MAGEKTDFGASSLSSVGEIARCADFSAGGFSATEALGGLVNNREFARGFVDYVNGRQTSQAYVWRCLSAVGEDIGETLFKNVEKYVDFVSNVETCKVTSLRSMMSQLGFDYTVFDNIEYVPKEVVDLMNVVSIDKKYLLKSGFVKDAFVEDMKRIGVIGASGTGQLSDYYDLSSGRDTGLPERSVSSLVIDDAKYQDYVEHLFTVLLSGFCSLEYNQPKTSPDQHYYIYRTLGSADLGLTDDEVKSSPDEREQEILDFAFSRNVSKAFRYKQIVDDIDAGTDSLDNYAYPEADVLRMEMARRAAKVSRRELTFAASVPSEVSGYADGESVENCTRYSYYRKQKVIEYVGFINNKYFIDNALELSSSVYSLDPNYIEALSPGANYVLSAGELNADVIRSVAKSLAIASQYVCKLREKVKLQTRKTYMKGTQNLLLYIINEYLIDYSRHKAQTVDAESYGMSESDRLQLARVLGALSSHSMNQLDVVEYYDTTQYYNLSTASSADADEPDEVNERFWDKVDMAADDGMSYRLSQIGRFYSDVMAMKNDLTGMADLSDFLATIFDVGADDSYMAAGLSGDPVFSTRLSAHGGRFAGDVLSEYGRLSSSFETVKGCVDGKGYARAEDAAVSAQISDLTGFIERTQLEERLSGVSAVYDEYMPRVEEISGEVWRLAGEYGGALSGDTSLYFVKSDCKYCYDGDMKYRHDWYVGNPAYDPDGGYLSRKFRNFSRFLSAVGQGEKNVVNWPLVDTVAAVSAECGRICAEYETGVVAEIAVSGYYDIHAPTLDEELNSGYTYLEKLADSRLEFLRKTLEQVRTEANLLREAFNATSLNKSVNIELQADSVIDQIGQIGGNFDGSEYTDLDHRINAIVEYVSTKFGESFFEMDSQVSSARALMGKISDLSAQYLPYKADFDALRSDPSQAAYLAGLVGGQLTFQALDDCLEYARQKDNESRLGFAETGKAWEKSLESAYGKYAETASELQDLDYEWQCLDWRQRRIPYQRYKDKSDGIVELGLSGANDWLLNVDLDAKRNDAEAETGRIVSAASAALGVIREELSAQLASRQDLFDAVSERLSSLNVFQDSQYVQRQQAFLTYAGKDFCYYPYYNHQNATHPSYQVHPFLWNFVAKDSASLGDMTKTFYGYKAESLAESTFKISVDALYGEFGQAVNKWLDPGIYDYTGYATEYEQSQRVENTTGRRSAVVGYEGAFYPPAVEELKSAYGTDAHSGFYRCLASLSGAVAFDGGFESACRARLSSDVAKLVSLIDNYDSGNNVSSVTYAGDLSVYALISAYVEPYVVKSDLKRLIDEYFSTRLVGSQLSSVSVRGLVKSVAAGLEPTFYEKYYHHLQFENNQAERDYLVGQLCSYFPGMLSGVLGEHALSDAYDIYRCGRDASGNTYALFKRYGDQDPTYYDKKNAAGSLWIRLKDHPFAFPAFTGAYPNSKALKRDDLPHLVADLAEAQGWSGESPITSDMDVFYDFEIGKDGKTLCLVSKMAVDGRIPTSETVQRYENPWVSICTTAYTDLSAGRVLVDLKKYEGLEQTSDQYLRSGGNPVEMPALTREPEEGNPIDNYAFLGQYLKNNTTVAFVYAKKRYFAGGKVELLDGVRIHQAINGIVNSAYEVNAEGVFSGQVGDQAAFAYDAGILTFAYLRGKDMGVARADVTGSCAELSVNTAGAAYGDPRDSEMNSHDVFTTDVAVTKYEIFSNTLRKAANSDGQAPYNMNADMAYLPSYPGVSGEISAYAVGRLSGELMSAGLRFQLLGNSKNIDSQIERVNPDVDPYFDMNRISSDFTFGRVYEDYGEFAGKDGSFRLFQNPSINSRTGGGSRDCLVWEISLSGFGYSDRDFDRLQIAAYSKKTLGKNPYVIAGLKSIQVSSPEEWIDVPNYSQTYSAENSRETEITTTEDAPGAVFTATGTYSAKKFFNRTDSNHIDNVRGLQVQFVRDRTSPALRFKFVVENESQLEYTYVGEGDVQVLLYNRNDLKAFNYFHYLDAYGAINAAEGRLPPVEVLSGNGWTFTYRTGKSLDPSAALEDIKAYGEMKRSGGLDVDLGQYEYLSDVYALKGRKRLSFKYSDDDAFAFDSENYYYPTLNVKYPKTMGDFITSTSCQLEQAARTMDLSNTFDDGNLFVFDLVDPAVSADFGRVEIEMAYDGAGEMEGFEEMTEFANSDGEVTATISGFFNRYDAYDARSLGQVEFSEFNALSDTADPARVFAIVAAISSTHFGTERFLSALRLSAAAEGLDAVPFGSEPAKARALDAVAFDVKRADIADLLKLYVNYKRSDEGIVLYFNYYNYLNTPFVKVVDGKAYPDYIESSYCRVAPRETGYVSIVVQLKYYKNGDLAGYKNATVATYKVTNLSDDKPKFAIEEVSRLKKGDLKKIGESPNVTVTVRDAVIDLSAYSAESQSENPEFSLYVDIETDRRLSAPYEFGIDYPYDLAEPTGVDGAGFEVDKSVNGYFGVTVSEKSLDTVKIGMRMKKTVSELSSYVNRYQVLADKAFAIGENGEPASVDCVQGAIDVRDSRPSK